MTTNALDVSIPCNAGRAQDDRVALVATIAELDFGVLLRLEGTAILDDLPALQAAVIRLSARRARLTMLDLSDLTAISSLAIGLLVGLRRGLARWGCRIEIVNCSWAVREALERTGVAALFEFCHSVEEVLAVA